MSYDSADRRTPTPAEAAQAGTVEELDAALLDVHGVSASSDFEAVLRLAAVQVTLWVWRNSPFEDIQIGVPASEAPARFAAEASAIRAAEPDLVDPEVGGLSNGQMMMANVEVTSLVLSHLSARSVDWAAIEQDLCNPARLVAGEPLSQRSAQHDVAALYPHVRSTVARYQQLTDLVGWPRLVRALAVMAWTSSWWGKPEWPDKVDAFLDELGPDPWADTRVAGLSPAIAREALVRDPATLGHETLTWAVRHGLGFANGREAYRARRGLPADTAEPANAAWSGLVGLSGYAPTPGFWEYALADQQRHTATSDSTRTPSRQVTFNDTTSVWVNELTCAGVARLLGRLRPGDKVWFNGNPLEPRRGLPNWMVGRPANLGGGPVLARGAGWVSVGVADNPGAPPYTAVFVDLSTDGDQADLGAVSAALGEPGDDGRYLARVWVADGVRRDPVRAAHWPTLAEMEVLLRPS